MDCILVKDVLHVGDGCGGGAGGTGIPDEWLAPLKRLGDGLAKMRDAWEMQARGIAITRGKDDPGYKAMEACISELYRVAFDNGVDLQ